MRIHGAQNKIPLFLALKVFFRVALEEIVKTTIMQVESDIFYCVLGLKKSSNLARWSHFNFPTSTPVVFRWESSPRALTPSSSSLFSTSDFKIQVKLLLSKIGLFNPHHVIKTVGLCQVLSTLLLKSSLFTSIRARGAQLTRPRRPCEN